MVEVVATESDVNLLYCASVDQFVLNNPITLQYFWQHTRKYDVLCQNY